MEPYNLDTAAELSYKLIEDDSLCLEVWGVMSLCAQGLREDVFNTIFAGRLREAEAACDRLIDLSIISPSSTDGIVYTMLTPLKKLVFNYVESPDSSGGERHSIMALLTYFESVINDAIRSDYKDSKAFIRFNDALNDIIYMEHFLLHNGYHNWLEILHSGSLDLHKQNPVKSQEIIKTLDEYFSSLYETNQDVNCVLLGCTKAVRGTVEFRLGNNAAAEGLYNRAREILQDTDMQKYILVTRELAEMELLIGKYEEASRLFDEVVEKCIQIEDVTQIALVNLSFGDLLILAGHTDEGIKKILEARGLFEQIGDEANYPQCDLQLAGAYIGLGLIDESEKLLNNAYATFLSFNDSLGLANCLCMYSEIEITHQNWEKAESYAQRSIDLYEDNYLDGMIHAFGALTLALAAQHKREDYITTEQRIYEIMQRVQKTKLHDRVLSRLDMARKLILMG